MRVMAAAALAAATMPAAPAARADDAEVERLVRQHVQPMLIAAGGMAVAVHIEGRTLFFNYGMADVARKEPITSDSLFNLASVTKVFLATLLAQAVKQGEVALEDPVAKYVTELQQGGDIRNVTLGELASHTSGLTRTPQQYEPAHRGAYKLPDFIRYSIPGRPTTRICRASRRSIPTPASFCFRSRCSGASTRRSPSSWTRGSLRRSG